MDPKRNSDLINLEYYRGKSRLQVIDIIEICEFNFHIGNAVKYLLRAGKKTKDPIDDLKKVKWYLDRFLSMELFDDYTFRSFPEDEMTGVFYSFDVSDSVKPILNLLLLEPNNQEFMIQAAMEVTALLAIGKL